MIPITDPAKKTFGLYGHSAPVIDPKKVEELKARSSALPVKTTSTGKKVMTVTQEWLDEHDRQTWNRCMKTKQQELREYAREVLNRDFKKRQELFEGEEGLVLTKVYALVVASSVKVLVRDFGWSAVGGGNRVMKSKKLFRFALALQEELDRILTGRVMDIKKYAEEVYAETGVMFGINEEEVPEDGDIY